MLNKILLAFWANTKKQDDKRIATLTMPEGVKEINNFEYLPTGHKYHKLDVYYPENATGKLPVIIDIHGGGWMYGDKELNKPYCLTLAKKGNVVFNISYRLFPEVTADEQLRDVAKALEWIYENMDNFPCDKSSVCLTGDSAGGMLAFFTSMLSQSEKMRELYDIEDFRLKFNAVGLVSPMMYMDDSLPVGFYTKHVLGKNYKSKKWANYVNAETILPLGDMIPAFLVSSKGDFLASDHTLRAAKLFKEKGIDCELIYHGEGENAKLPHVFSILYPESEVSNEAIEAMLSFFKKHSTQTV